MYGGDMNLYSNNNSTNIKGTGYKDKQSALHTLDIIKNRSLIYQKSVVITMYYRAKYHKNRTKNMEDAMLIFRNWLKTHKTLKTKYEYLPLGLITKYKKLANVYNISLDFLNIYNKVNGNYRKLSFIPIAKINSTKINNTLDYDIIREKQIDKLLKKNSTIKLYNSTGPYINLPTKQHMKLIMYGYSMDKLGLINRLKLLKNI